MSPITTTTNINDIEIPDFPRKFTREQPAGPRVFMASGPKADAIIRHLIAGTFTTEEIVAATGCSASRVSECRWALDAAGIKYAVAKKARTQKAAAPALSVAEACARAWQA